MRKRKLQLDREILSSNNGAADVDGATGWSLQQGCTQTCIQTICYGVCSLPSNWPVCPTGFFCPDDVV